MLCNLWCFREKFLRMAPSEKFKFEHLIASTACPLSVKSEKTKHMNNAQYWLCWPRCIKNIYMYKHGIQLIIHVILVMYQMEIIIVVCI